MTPLEAVLDRTEPNAAASRHAPTGRLRLLVADDQRDVQDALRMLLSAHDFTVHIAGSPADALNVVRTHPVDAALIDLNYEKGRTSGEQGLELVAALLKHDPQMPIVVMTETAAHARQRPDPTFSDRASDLRLRGSGGRI